MLINFVMILLAIGFCINAYEFIVRTVKRIKQGYLRG